MIQQAHRSSPNASFAGAFFPNSNRSALTLLMAQGARRDFTQMDYIYFDPATGRQLALWRRGVTDTWGAKFIFWVSPLHFGYDWGLAIKIIWAVLGCASPLLSITAVLTYWNRSLSKKWKALKERTAGEPSSTSQCHHPSDAVVQQGIGMCATQRCQHDTGLWNSRFRLKDGAWQLNAYNLADGG
jgi:uncharacterized iron-regulated membrane protein